MEVWKEVLALDDVGVTDNFFEVGGHSLLAMRLIANVEDRLRVRFTVVDVFRCPTIRQMAELAVCLETAIGGPLSLDGGAQSDTVSGVIS
jgi:acyl carrier protein